MQYKLERAKIKVKPELKDEIMNKIKSHIEDNLQ
jgi:hypothetical protein